MAVSTSRQLNDKLRLSRNLYSSLSSTSLHTGRRPDFYLFHDKTISKIHSGPHMLFRVL